MTNRGIALENESDVNVEKMRGRFIVHNNPRLPMRKQIEKYANEPIAYQLHKTRNFFERLNEDKNIITTDEAIANIRRKMKE